MTSGIHAVKTGAGWNPDEPVDFTLTDRAWRVLDAYDDLDEHGNVVVLEHPCDHPVEAREPIVYELPASDPDQVWICSVCVEEVSPV